MNWRKVILFVLIATACTEQIDIQPNDLVFISAPSVSQIDENGVFLESVFRNVDISSVEDHGFIWSESQGVNMLNSEILSLGVLEGTNIASRVATRLAEGQKYYSRAYIKTSESITVSDTTSFTSLGSGGPSLTSFSPRRGYLSDTLTLVGKNFSALEKNQVFFANSQEASITSQASDTIKVIPPSTLAQARTKITVTVAGASTVFDDEFELISPRIDGFDKLVADFSDTVEIITADHPSRPEDIEIYLENPSSERHQIQQTSILTNPLRFVIEPSIAFREFKVIVGFNNFEATSEANLRIVEPTITGVSESEIKYDQRVRVFGTGFNPIIENNKVFFDTLKAEITEVGSIFRNGQQEDFIEAIVPFSIENGYSSRIIDYRVEVNGFGLNSSETVEITNQWFLVNSSPSTINRFSATASINGAGYAVSSDSKLYQYEPVANVWTMVSILPTSPRSNAILFGIGNNLYYGLGQINSNSSLKDMWRYSTTSNQWTRLADFPGTERSYPTVGSKGNMAFLYGGLQAQRFTPISLQDFWRFDGNTESWSRLGDHPNTGVRGSMFFNDQGIFARSNGSSTRDTREVYRYDQTTDAWSLFSLYPESSSDLLDAMFGNIEDSSLSFLFALSENNSTRIVYSFNTLTKEWSRLDNAPMSGAYFFTLNNKMYIYGSDFPVRGSFWEFDPDRE